MVRQIFEKTKLLALLICITAAVTMSDCNLKFSDFVMVRQTTCQSIWFKASDDLKGTATSYGTLGTDCNFNIEFDGLPYDEVLLTTNDKKYWAVTTKTEVAKMSAHTVGVDLKEG